jgi:hypothetical protein
LSYSKKNRPLRGVKKWWLQEPPQKETRILALRQAIRFAKEKVTLNINLSYTDTRGAMVN